MNTLILNRAGKLPDDGWYEIETPGEHLNADAGVVQLLDGTAFDSIVNRFKAEAAKPNFAGLLIDQDHFSLDPSKSTESFGWLMEVRNRDGHLEGRIDWTDIGEPAVKQKRFKFFSSVYDLANVEKVGTRTVRNRAYPLIRPLALDRLALTNDPNNKGGKPISNRNGNDVGAAENPTESTMKKLLKLLGLADDASEDSAVSAVQTIQNRATTAEAKVSALTTERDELLDAQVEADLDKYAGVIANRDTVKAQLLANRKGTLVVLEGLKQPGAADPTKITNRATAKTPAGTPSAAEIDAAKERARGQKVANRAAELRRTNPRLTRSQAFAKAEAEIAE